MESSILRFENPQYLYWLLIIPVLVAIYVLIRLWNKRQFGRFANIKLRGYLVPMFSNARANTKFVIFNLIIALLIIAGILVYLFLIKEVFVFLFQLVVMIL